MGRRWHQGESGVIRSQLALSARIARHHKDLPKSRSLEGSTLVVDAARAEQNQCANDQHPDGECQCQPRRRRRPGLGDRGGEEGKRGASRRRMRGGGGEGGGAAGRGTGRGEPGVGGLCDHTVIRRSGGLSVGVSSSCWQSRMPGAAVRLCRTRLSVTITTTA